MVKARGDISRHFHVLNLITTHRHIVRIKSEDVSRHENRIGKQTHGNPVVRIFTGLFIRLHRTLVGVGSIHQAFGCVAGQDPRQLSNLRYIRLPIKVSRTWVKTKG